jgi:murein DD-endopeptidase MepM/ murein hydrolase activator NlpD
MGQRWNSKAIGPICVAVMMLAGCASNDNWWDQNGNARGSNNSYVPGTPLAAPDRYAGTATSSKGGTYTVKRGETLYAISREKNIPIRSLIDANHLEPPYMLRSGQRLILPSARYHVVVAGDTVYSISRTYGVDMATLTATNHVPAPYNIKVGQRLQLPSQVNTQVAAAVNDEQTGPSGVPVRRPDNNYTTTMRSPVPAARPGSGVKAPLPPPPVPAGSFIWPAQGRIISTYGAKEGGMHNDGINIAVPSGTPVHAAQSGVVAYAGNELKGYGNLLLVRHANGWMTAYAHNSKLLVKRGDTVARGQTISLAGSTGSVTSPQVHFELRKGAKAVDPRSVIGG